jgi:hypothetical protein
MNPGAEIAGFRRCRIWSRRRSVEDEPIWTRRWAERANQDGKGMLVEGEVRSIYIFGIKSINEICGEFFLVAIFISCWLHLFTTMFYFFIFWISIAVFFEGKDAHTQISRVTIC